MIKSGRVGLRSDGDYDYETFWVKCDRCGKSFEPIFPERELFTFQEAVDYKKKIGFRSFKVGDKWKEYCPDCYKKKVKEDNEKILADPYVQKVMNDMGLSPYEKGMILDARGWKNV